MSNKQDLPVILLARSNPYAPVDVEWVEGMQQYRANDTAYFQLDQKFHRLIATQRVPEGYMGWFGHGDAHCVGGPAAGQTLALLHRAERKDIFEALSR